MFKINHILKKPENILPSGVEHKTLNWFELTDGQLWIEAGDGVIYEYAEPLSFYNEFNELTRYNDYQLSRFLEDFFDTFPYVVESLPDFLYNDIETLEERMDKLLSLYEDKSDEEYDEFCSDVYDVLWDPVFMRSIDSAHLTGGPNIRCFRHEDKLKLLWISECNEYDGARIWKYQKGASEMDYSVFVSEVMRFYNAFSEDMDRQVENVKNNGIPGVEVDIEKLCIENEQRKAGFQQKIDSLNSVPQNITDWKRIKTAYDRMTEEIS